MKFATARCVVAGKTADDSDSWSGRSIKLDINAPKVASCSNFYGIEPPEHLIENLKGRICAEEDMALAQYIWDGKRERETLQGKSIEGGRMSLAVIDSLVAAHNEVVEARRF